MKPKIDSKTLDDGNFKFVFLETMILRLQTYKKWGRDVPRPNINNSAVVDLTTKRVLSTNFYHAFTEVFLNSLKRI